MSLQVVIIDEAHNLSDTLSCIHSTELTGAQVRIHRTSTPGLNDALPNGVNASTAVPRPFSAQPVRRSVQVSADVKLAARVSHVPVENVFRVWHQEQAEGEEPDVHQADSLCDGGAHPGAGR